jgi:hypothetical protein
VLLKYCSLCCSDSGAQWSLQPEPKLQPLPSELRWSLSVSPRSRCFAPDSSVCL